jgi:hypothetical protein
VGAEVAEKESVGARLEEGDRGGGEGEEELGEDDEEGLDRAEGGGDDGLRGGGGEEEQEDDGGEGAALHGSRGFIAGVGAAVTGPGFICDRRARPVTPGSARDP